MSHRVIVARRPRRWWPLLLVAVTGLVVGLVVVRPGLTVVSPAAGTAPAQPSQPSQPLVPTPVPSATGGPGFARACDPLAAARELPLRSRLAQMIMVGVSSADASEALAVVRDEQVGGIFLPGSDTGLLTGDALAPVHAAAERSLLVSIDDEGGRVQRLDDLDGSIPSARVMAATMTLDQVRALALERGRAMLARGVTMDLAPVLDVTDAPDRTVIGDRSFSPDPAVAERYARAFADGLRDAGVAVSFKHFPGHGNASGDSHEGSVSTPPLDELRGRDLLPYAGLTAADGAVMLGHLEVPGLTEPNTPASISPAAVSLLRDEIGFDGLVMTDDLVGMRAITDRIDLPDAVLAAVRAGVDMALFISADRLGEVLDRLEVAVASGELSQRRVDEGAAAVLRFTGAAPTC